MPPNLKKEDGDGRRKESLRFSRGFYNSTLAPSQVFFIGLGVSFRLRLSLRRLTTLFPILHGAATVETGTQRLFQDALTLIPFNLGENDRRDTVVVGLGAFR